MQNPTPRISDELIPVISSPTARWVHEAACRDCCICTVDNRIMPSDLEDFTARVLEAYGAPVSEARIVARNLVASDERGIPSHGVARLGRYLDRHQGGHDPSRHRHDRAPSLRPALGVVDACNGLGQVAGEIGMKLAIAQGAEPTASASSP